MTFDTTGLTEKTHSNGGTTYLENAEGKITAKACTKCGEVKGLEGFHREKEGFVGRKSRCRECAIKYSANYYRNNRDNIAEYHTDYYRNNRDKILEYHAEYHRNNRDKIAENKAEHHRNNPHLVKIRSSRRRARLRNIPDDLTHTHKAQILRHFDGACALTGDIGDGHLDHVIPISVGHGGTIYENMIPLRADLNISKGARNIFDWFADNRERFGLEQRKFNELIEYLADINDMSTKEYEEYVRWCHDNPRTIDEIKAEKDDDGASA